MSVTNEDLVLELGDGDDLELVDDTGQELGLEDSVPYYTANYEQLRNKPQIDGVELVGNKMLTELFANGFVLDGGDAEAMYNAQCIMHNEETGETGETGNSEPGNEETGGDNGG